MNLSELVSAVEDCVSQAELKAKLQGIVEDFGFSGYCFIDIGQPHVDVPYFEGTTGPAWEREYETNGFIHVDQCISLARRINTPFHWASVPLPGRLGKKKPKAMELMDAATDHGFKEGLDVPFHYVDALGRWHSSICVLMWKDRLPDFYKVESLALHELHLVLIYWMQRSIELREAQRRKSENFNVATLRDTALQFNLTDREREVLTWAGRGKTSQDIADILAIKLQTVKWYMKQAVDKLGAGNTTHAVAKAIAVGAIDI